MRRAIPGGRRSITILLPIPLMEVIEGKRKARSQETGRYVSTGEIIREYLECGLAIKDEVLKIWKPAAGGGNP